MADVKKDIVADVKTILADRGLDGSGKDIWPKRLGEITEDEVKWALSRKPGYYVLDRLLILISPAAENFLEQMAQIAHQQLEAQLVRGGVVLGRLRVLADV